MNLSGWEKPLDQYTKTELVELAKKYSISYKTPSGQTSMSNYGSLTKPNLIELIRNDRDYVRSRPQSRMELLKMRLKGVTDPEDIMLEIMDVLNEVDIIPDAGGFYTYVYNAKTPDLWYDQHPLIKCESVFQWGFRGYNFHWPEYRNYTWNEVAGQLHIVKYTELGEMLSIPYKKILKVGRR